MEEGPFTHPSHPKSFSCIPAEPPLPKLKKLRKLLMLAISLHVGRSRRRNMNPPSDQYNKNEFALKGATEMKLLSHDMTCVSDHERFFVEIRQKELGSTGLFRIEIQDLMTMVVVEMLQSRSRWCTYILPIQVSFFIIRSEISG